MEDSGRQDAVPVRGLQELVLQRVLAIDPVDPDRRRKAFRIFLESVLTDEFGPQLLNDPAFHRVIDSVQKTMEHDTALLPAIVETGDFLLESAREVSYRTK